MDQKVERTIIKKKKKVIYMIYTYYANVRISKKFLICIFLTVKTVQCKVRYYKNSKKVS